MEALSLSESAPVRNSTSSAETPKVPGLLTLPRELRDLIYEYLVFKPTNTITILPDLCSPNNDISARPPPISAANRQLHAEVMPLFYAGNTFTAQLDNAQDLAVTRTWLSTLGDRNIQYLKRFTMCGWTSAPFGHMILRRYVTVGLDLKEGTLEIQGNDEELLRSSGNSETFDEFQKGFAKMVAAREGEPFDVRSVEQLLAGFNLLCTCY